MSNLQSFANELSKVLGLNGGVTSFMFGKKQAFKMLSLLTQNMKGWTNIGAIGDVEESNIVGVVIASTPFFVKDGDFTACCDSKVLQAANRPFRLDKSRILLNRTVEGIEYGIPTIYTDGAALGLFSEGNEVVDDRVIVSYPRHWEEVDPNRPRNMSCTIYPTNHSFTSLTKEENAELRAEYEAQRLAVASAINKTGIGTRRPGEMLFVGLVSSASIKERNSNKEFKGRKIPSMNLNMPFYNVLVRGLTMSSDAMFAAAGKHDAIYTLSASPSTYNERNLKTDFPGVKEIAKVNEFVEKSAVKSGMETETFTPEVEGVDLNDDSDVDVAFDFDAAGDEEVTTSTESAPEIKEIATPKPEAEEPKACKPRRRKGKRNKLGSKAVEPASLVEDKAAELAAQIEADLAAEEMQAELAQKAREEASEEPKPLSFEPTRKLNKSKKGRGNSPFGKARNNNENNI